MKIFFTPRAFFALLLLLSGFAYGQQTITSVSITTPAAPPYCLGGDIEVRVNYSGFGTTAVTKQFTVEASDNAGNFPSSELFVATTVSGTNATRLTTAKITLLRTAAFSSNYKIRVTAVSPSSGVTGESTTFSINGNVPIGTASLVNNICSGGTFAHTLVADLPGTTFSWPSITSGAFVEIPIAASSGSPTSISQVLTATAQTNTAPSVTYKVIPTAPDGCVGASFDVKASVFKIINPGSFAATAKTICSGTTSEALPTLTGASFVGSTTSPPVYSWERSTVSDFTSDVTTPGNAATFSETEVAVLTNATNLSKIYYYRRKVTLGGNCVDYSNTYILTVAPAVRGGTIVTPTPNTLCSGGDPGEVIEATPAVGLNLTYQWYRSTNGTTFNTNGMTGAINATYAPGALTATRWYRRQATGTLADGTVCPVAVSNDVQIIINRVDEGAIASDQEFCKTVNGSDPTPVTITSTTPGTSASGGTITYQWQRNTVTTSASYTDVSGADQETYTPPANGGVPIYYYRRQTKSTLNELTCTATSTAVHVSVNTINPGSIGGGSLSICSGGDPAAFTSAAAGTATINPAVTYQWQSAIVAGGPYTDILLATSATFDPPAGLTQTTYFVRKTMHTPNSSSYTTCEALSNEIVVTVNSIPDAAATNKSICGGSGTALTVTNPNNILGASFTWVASYGAVTGGAASGSGSFGTNAISENLTNATNAPIDVVYTITPVGPEPTNCQGTPIDVTVTVNPLPTLATLTLANDLYEVTTCNGNSVNLKVVITGGTSPYKVQVYSLAEVTGYTSGANIPTGPLAGNVTPYSYSIASVYDANNCPVNAISGFLPVSVYVNQAPSSVTINPSYVGDICTGTSVSYSSTLLGTVIGTPVYDWKDGANAALSGTPTAASASNVWNGSAGPKSVKLNVSVAGCPAVESNVGFNQNAQPAPVSITGTPITAVCEGTTLNFGSTAISGGTTPAYAWAKSTDGGFNFGSPLGTNASYSEVAVHPGAVYKLEVTYPLNSGCNSLSDSRTVNVNKKPDALASAINPSICTGQTATVSVSNPNSVAGATFKWTAVYTNVSGGSGSSTPITGVAFSTSAISEALTTTTAAAGTATYTITPVGSGGTACEGTPITVTVTVNPLPTTPTITAGGPTTFCQGGSVILSAPASTSYLWSNTATTQTIAVTATGTFTLKVKDANQCESAPSLPVSVTVNPLPAQPTITASGPITFCVGGSVTLTSSVAAGYYWNPTGARSQSIQVTSGGTHTVQVIDGNGCVSPASLATTVTVNPLPVSFEVVGGGTSFCGSLLTLSLSGSQSGVNYQLKRNNNNVGAPVAGTGFSFDFPGVNQGGTYTVAATTVVGSCTLPMTGSAVINTATAPAAFTLSGGGVSCGGTLKAIHLSGSQIGVSYQLKRGTTVIITLQGTGNELDFPSQNVAGNYTVDALSNCPPRTMTNTVSITSVALATIYNVTGGGTSCGAPIAIGLSDSQTGASYQLYRGNTPVGTTVSGTGNALNFGSQTVAGDYSIVAITGGECSIQMNGTATVTIIPAPATFNVTGGGVACGSGAVVGLSGSQKLISYQLKRGSTNVGLPVDGTGSAITFGPQSVAGNYTVVATTCSTPMTGTVSVTSAGTTPILYNVTGGGAYCNNVPLPIGLSDSQTGVYYQLQRDTGNGFGNVGTTVQGTGSAITFGNHSVIGSYRIVVNSPCPVIMNGTKSITACNSRIGIEEETTSAENWAAVAPNPVVSGQASLLIRNQVGQQIKWQMVDLKGGMVLEGSFEARTNAHQEDLNVGKMNAGNYLLQLQAGTKQMSLKVMKVE